MTRTARSRKHQGFDLEARLAPVERAIERHPFAWRGVWDQWQPSVVEPIDVSSFFEVEPDYSLVREEIGVGDVHGAEADAVDVARGDASGKRWREVRVDLGCGKGSFTVASAQREPDVLFVGVDCEQVCAMHGGEKAIEADVDNVVFTLDEDPHIECLFGSDELSTIYINFPAPFPKKKQASRRLMYVDRLLAYRQALRADGELWLRTDSEPFFLFSKNQLELAGFEIFWETGDCRAARPDDPETWYEKKLTAKGARVFALVAKQGSAPAPNPEDVVQTAPMSLYDYLPEDLENMQYVPHGMANGVENMLNYRRNLMNRHNK